MTATCGNCYFGEIVIGDDQRPRVDCHRFPPGVIDYEGVPTVLFPQVNTDDWCGEYVPSSPDTGPGNTDHEDPDYQP